MNTLEILLLITACLGVFTTVLWVERDCSTRRERQRAAGWQRDYEWLRARWPATNDFNDGEGI
jgi:hypothetical protein